MIHGKKNVASLSDAAEAMGKLLDVVEPLLGGTLAMRQKTELLPMWPNEDKDAYAQRLNVATLFPAYGRTVSTLSGKPFSKSITLEGVPTEIEEWLKNCDLQGRNLDAFSGDVFEAAVGRGRVGILVEYPRAENVPANAEGVRTVEAERAAGLRPYFVEIAARQILGWKVKLQGGQWTLVQLRIMECVEEEDPQSEFHETKVEQVRVLDPGRWRIYRKSKSSPDEWDLHDEGVTTLDFIPFVPVYGKRVGYMCGEPPLMDVAYLNIKHWQSQSDQDTILHVARVPILAVTGLDNAKSFTLTVGANTAIKLTGEADIKYVEHTGAAIEAGKVSLDDLKEEMRQAGAELLVLQPNITATQVASESSIGMCPLQRMTLDFQDALNLAIQYMGAYVGVESAGTCKLFLDFGAATLAEASASILIGWNTAGKLSDKTTFAELQRRGIIAAERSWDDEQDLIDEQGPPLGMEEVEDEAEDAKRKRSGKPVAKRGSNTE